MNIGLPELGVLGFLLLILFGSKKAGGKKTSSEKTTQRESQTVVASAEKAAKPQNDTRYPMQPKPKKEVSENA